jgi:hypothetical protein
MLLLSACSGSGTPGTTAGLPSAETAQHRALSDVARSGVAPKFLGLIGHVHATGHRNQPDTGRQIYVSDFGTNVVELLKYRRWTSLGTISNGVNGPDGNWVDKNGNFYVANYANPNITEYDPSGNLMFTYSTGIADPVDVTTDKVGNVYEADFNYTVSGGGYVNEYAQGSNTVAATCSQGGNVESVAVDKHGNVFVYYNNPSGGASITEYAGGLTGCNGTVLPISFGFAGGMAIDKQGDLVVCDQIAPAVDVIAPPYTSITSTLGSGWSDPFHVTIDKAGTQAYVADLAAADVQVLTYPGGSSVATLGSANGLSSPASAVDSKNYVP